MKKKLSNPTAFFGKGRKILSQLYEENAEKVQLDVSNLQNGIYFLKVSGQQEILLVERVGKK